jgi:two-component system, LytTR family, response regulator
VTIRVWIIDDEPLARQGLRGLLASTADLEIIGESPDGRHAVREIPRHRPDLIFLDVQMPGLDGFEVLSALTPDELPAVIFVTAHDAHALRAFSVHAIDYLLKPVDPDRLSQAVERARQTLPGLARADTEARLRDLLRTVQSEHYAERLLIRSAGEITVVPVSEIDSIRADGDYARILQGKQAHLLRETLQSLESRLDPRVFIRIHRSHLVRLARVRRVKMLENGEGIALLHDGTELPVSRTCRDALVQALRGTE